MISEGKLRWICKLARWVPILSLISIVCFVTQAVLDEYDGSSINGFELGDVYLSATLHLVISVANVVINLLILYYKRNDWRRKLSIPWVAVDLLVRISVFTNGLYLYSKQWTSLKDITGCAHPSSIIAFPCVWKENINVASKIFRFTFGLWTVFLFFLDVGIFITIFLLWVRQLMRDQTEIDEDREMSSQPLHFTPPQNVHVDVIIPTPSPKLQLLSDGEISRMQKEEEVEVDSMRGERGESDIEYPPIDVIIHTE